MIAQVLTMVLLSGAPNPQQPVQVKSETAADARKAEWVCERQRLTGSNVRQTVCIDKRTRKQNRKDAEDIVEREQDRLAQGRNWR